MQILRRGPILHRIFATLGQTSEPFSTVFSLAKYLSILTRLAYLLGHLMLDFEIAVSTRALRMNDALGNPLTVKLGQLVDQV